MASLNDIIATVKRNAERSGKIVGKIAEDSIKKAGEVIEISKIKLKIMDMQSQVEDLYKKIGREVYRNFAEPDTSFDEDSVNKSMESIKDLEEQMQLLCAAADDLRGAARCACGEMVHESMRFCPGCGEKIS